VTVPSCIPAGDYLLRGEIIALHSAGSYPGAQFYMECAQIRVTGGGSTQPSTVSIPGTYSGNDPGIKINIYSGLTSYQIPGPRPFSCSGGNPTTTTKPPTTTTTTTTTTKPPTTTSSPPSGGTAPHYGQCGGIGWTGPTTCESPWTCTKSNDYYSQCL
jgi:cellulase